MQVGACPCPYPTLRLTGEELSELSHLSQPRLPIMDSSNALPNTLLAVNGEWLIHPIQCSLSFMDGRTPIGTVLVILLKVSTFQGCFLCSCDECAYSVLHGQRRCSLFMSNKFTNPIGETHPMSAQECLYTCI